MQRTGRERGLLDLYGRGIPIILACDLAEDLVATTSIGEHYSRTQFGLRKI